MLQESGFNGLARKMIRTLWVVVKLTTALTRNLTYCCFVIVAAVYRAAHSSESPNIELIGLRSGEKLRQELFVPKETYKRTAREKIFAARNGIKPKPDEYNALCAALDALIQTARAGTAQEARAQLGRIVPEFKHSAFAQ
ncbi:MAG: hypothetical protein B6D41_22610 [Chloroflexi bacterium UTCFX4]|jgi:FlaA1/EpsC-like NDP-sugar epimerase|nr:MAG: hypothetical protein B6D41_22610 [Chloroflexi bacterium UTCFX4]